MRENNKWEINWKKILTGRSNSTKPRERNKDLDKLEKLKEKLLRILLITMSSSLTLFRSRALIKSRREDLWPRNLRNSSTKFKRRMRDKVRYPTKSMFSLLSNFLLISIRLIGLLPLLDFSTILHQNLIIYLHTSSQ